jgi:hypothetical protein
MIRYSLVMIALVGCSRGHEIPATPPHVAHATEENHAILDAALASQRELPAQATKDGECAGAVTLGALVKQEMDAHPKGPVVTKCDGDAPPYTCSVFIGTASPNPDPTNPNWKPTQFSVEWAADKQDGTEEVTDGTLECH